jgi:hypothetical protein
MSEERGRERGERERERGGGVTEIEGYHMKERS